MFFVQDQRPKLVQANPDLKFGEVGKRVRGPGAPLGRPDTDAAPQLGEAWKNLTDKEKEPFVKKAQADKVRYEKEKGN